METKNTVETLRESKKPDRRAEDSLENTFDCVPKVQGESRISQAKGQGCIAKYEAVLDGLLFVFYLTEKDGSYHE